MNSWDLWHVDRHFLPLAPIRQELAEIGVQIPKREERKDDQHRGEWV